jgi:hypothetical protein
VLPDIKQEEYVMINAAFNSIAGFDDGSDTPKTCKVVLNHKGQKAINVLNEQKLPCHGIQICMGIYLMSFVPAGIKVIGKNWVYIEKYDGSKRSRTGAQGFRHVQGKYFTEIISPAMSDIAICLAIIIQFLMKLHTRQFDIVLRYNE